MSFPIVEEGFGTQVTPEYCHQVLGGYPVSRFVEEDGDEFIRRTPEKGIEYHHFGNGVVGTPCMSANSPSCPSGGEEDDRVSAELDVGFEGISLLLGQFGLRWV
jgi:hypothetical protein